jgi:hypothetical protein
LTLSLPQELRRIHELKASQVDGLRARVHDLEQQVVKKDVSLCEHKRLITSIKDVHEEKFRVS